MYSSFIITYHSRRLENLKQAIRFLEVNHLDVIKESELILVCQDNSPKISTQFGQTHLHNLNVSCMHLPKLTNFGVEQAASKNLVILESDRMLPESYFEKALNSLKNGLMITTRIMYKLTEDATDKEILEKHGTFVLNFGGFRVKHLYFVRIEYICYVFFLTKYFLLQIDFKCR